MTNFNQELLRSSPALLALLGIVDYLQTSPPAFKNTKGSNQTVTSTALTLITWATSAAIDTASGWDGEDHKYTVPAGAGGYWGVYASLAWLVAADQDFIVIEVHVDSAAVAGRRMNAGGAAANTIDAFSLFNATVGAEIEVFGRNANSATSAVSSLASDTQVFGIRLGP